MRGKRVTLLLSATLAVTLIVGPGAAEAKVKCGKTITKDVTLHKDLEDCPGNGLVIGDDNVTLDLNGHRLDGVGAPQTGVENAGHDNVVVKGGGGGRITHFGRGVDVTNGAANGRIRGIEFKRIDDDFSGGQAVALFSTADAVIKGNEVTDMKEDDGIAFQLQSAIGTEVIRNEITDIEGDGSLGVWILFDADETLVKQNFIRNVGAHGVVVDNSDEARVRRNEIRNVDLRAVLIEGDADATRVKNNELLRNEDGVLLDGSAQGLGTRVIGNLASENAEDGIELDTPAAAVGDNLVLDNGDWGIEAEPGVDDLGGNKAAGNGEPAQCLNVDCDPP